MDEKSFQRRHDYVTVVNDLIGSRVLFVADDRKQESLEAVDQPDAQELEQRAAGDR